MDAWSGFSGGCVWRTVALAGRSGPEALTERTGFPFPCPELRKICLSVRSACSFASIFRHRDSGDTPELYNVQPDGWQPEPNERPDAAPVRLCNAVKWSANRAKSLATQNIPTQTDCIQAGKSTTAEAHHAGVGGDILFHAPRSGDFFPPERFSANGFDANAKWFTEWWNIQLNGSHQLLTLHRCTATKPSPAREGLATPV
ncbi:hypothetical protein ZHAS_00016288 [Anopheles sinensis]|uniref:Uncharacterized protein n=1 Tax=Anopheles sinensis TaxID=74873 RepID=A0A084WDL4_ANOSI|nr:hypothetical protein ZHAS_00016288 [Anopheles sinensis]